MIYNFLKRVVAISLSIFFKRIVVSGEENIPERGPLIIVSNHPNTLMDPLLIATMLKQRIGFIANGSIFRQSMLKRILYYFHVIPIYRRQDLLPGEIADHQKTFEQCHQYLDQGGTILIFPEGTSIYELKLREIKTGTARIALSMEDRFGFKRGLKILPIALDYTDPIQFRSSISVNIMPVITLEAYHEPFLSDSEQAVRDLSDNIRAQLAQFVVETTDKPQEQFLIKAHQFFTSYQDPASKWYINPKRSLDIRNQMAAILQKTMKEEPEYYRFIERKTSKYFNLLYEEKLTLGFFSQEFSKIPPYSRLFSMIALLIILLPVYIFGLLTNYIPFKLPALIFKAARLDIEYKAPFQMILGMILFPLFYFLETLLFRKYFGEDWGLTLLFILVLPLAGFITQFCWLVIRRIFRMWRYIFRLSPERKEKILKIRDELLKVLHLEMEKISLYGF